MSELYHSLKRRFPWQVKFAGKIIMSGLPIPYETWWKIKVFQHGGMRDPPYAYRVFMEHFENYSSGGRRDGFAQLELGPGDSLFSAMIARALGASFSYLVDVGEFACADIRKYIAMNDYLRLNGKRIVEISEADSVADVLSLCRTTYLTDGLDSLRSLPSESVDFIWSNAVLEHIRASEFEELVAETRRILRIGGVCSHRVDLKDHLGFSLNNLRFSDRFWESDLIAGAGFYTNRIRYSEMIEMFRKGGFSAEVADVSRWDRLPIAKSRLADRFAAMPDDELLVSGFSVVLR